MGNDAPLSIGKIVGTHGIKGHLKVFPYADSIDLFAPGKELVISQEGELFGTFRIVSARPHKGVILLALDGIASIEAAQEWIGCQLCIDKATLPQPEEGSYYWHQIIGLEVFQSGNRHLGRVEAILRTGSNDVYVVRDGKKEVLIPAIDSVVIDIDLKEKVLRVDLPEGLED
jgi:16S rRNA processing protein RimM